MDADYTIHNQVLEKVEYSKYLGVTISKNLSWKKHVENITTKATNTIFLQRNLSFTDEETRLRCYKTYVRPIVEYASTVLNSIRNATLITKLDSI